MAPGFLIPKPIAARRAAPFRLRCQTAPPDPLMFVSARPLTAISSWPEVRGCTPVRSRRGEPGRLVCHGGPRQVLGLLARGRSAAGQAPLPGSGSGSASRLEPFSSATRTPRGDGRAGTRRSPGTRWRGLRRRRTDRRRLGGGRCAGGRCSHVGGRLHVLPPVAGTRGRGGSRPRLRTAVRILCNRRVATTERALPPGVSAVIAVAALDAGHAVRGAAIVRGDLIHEGRATKATRIGRQGYTTTNHAPAHGSTHRRSRNTDAMPTRKTTDQASSPLVRPTGRQRHGSCVQ